MLDCILCLSSLTATSGWKFSHPVKFLWSKVLLHYQRVNCWIQSWSALAGPNSINILIFFIFPCLSENTCSLAKPKLDQSIKFERTKGNTCFNGYVFFFNVIESILFQDSSLGFATDFFLWYIICGQFLTSWCLREPNSSNLVVKGSSLNSLFTTLPEEITLSHAWACSSSVIVMVSNFVI